MSARRCWKRPPITPPQPASGRTTGPDGDQWHTFQLPRHLSIREFRRLFAAELHKRGQFVCGWEPLPGGSGGIAFHTGPRDEQVRQ